MPDHKPDFPPEYELLLEEHRELIASITEFQEWWGQVDELGVPRFAEMGDRLQRLRDLVIRHFADEEAGGYLTGVLEVAPQLSREIDELRPQHDELLETLDDFICRLKCDAPPFESWQAAGHEFDAFLADLRRHEGRENAVVQTAYGHDIGTGD
ncbi:MAG: hemerythrin domain-containing protein [Planctomycetaceae bacterium]